MKIKLVSLLKVVLLSLCMLSVSSAYAEYYLVYTDAQYVAGCDRCVVRHHYVRHRYHSCYHPRYRHRYSSPRRTHLDMRVYYVWRVYPAPGCNTGCNTGCHTSSHRGCATRYYDDGSFRSYYPGNSYAPSNCDSRAGMDCYRNAKPGCYVPCSSGCTSCQYSTSSSGGGYVNGYNTSDDYNYDTRTADDY